MLSVLQHRNIIQASRTAPQPLSLINGRGTGDSNPLCMALLTSSEAFRDRSTTVCDHFLTTHTITY